MDSKSSSLLASPSRRSSCHVPGSPKRHPGAHAKFSPQVHDSASERQEPKDEEQVTLRPGAVHVDTVRGAGKFAVRKGASRGRGLHLDIDFDGDLSGGTVQGKLRAALATNWGKVSGLFQTWDSDGTGMVSRQEFAEAMEALGLCASPAAIDGIFCSFDLDGSGEVDAEEMHKILRQTPPKPTLLTRNKWQRTLQPPPPLPLPATAATAAAAAAAAAASSSSAASHASSASGVCSAVGSSSGRLRPRRQQLGDPGGGLRAAGTHGGRRGGREVAVRCFVPTAAAEHHPGARLKGGCEGVGLCCCSGAAATAAERAQ